MRLLMKRLSFALLASFALGCATSPTPEASPPKASSAALLLLDMQGRSLDLEAALARGERVAFIFWQTWCAPCRREAPHIVQAQAQHGDAIRFVGVIPGREERVDDARVSATVAEWGYAFPQVRDRDMALSKALGVTGTPTIVVLGEGRETLFRGQKLPEDWASLRGILLQEGGAAAPPGEDCPGGVCPLPPE